MKEDYKINGERKKISLEFEIQVAEILSKMALYTHLSESEIANTAIKRFISQHKDFLPNEKVAKRA
jgi:hypothetical protein